MTAVRHFLFYFGPKNTIGFIGLAEATLKLRPE
jgi:hypothetical protein